MNPYQGPSEGESCISAVVVEEKEGLVQKEGLISELDDSHDNRDRWVRAF